MTGVIIIASVFTGAIVGWWLTITVITTMRSRSSTRTVRQWQDRALAAERAERARQRQDRQPGWDDGDTPMAA
jgi:hypothetical protein